MKRFFAIALLLATVLTLLPAALSVSAEAETPALIITEVCFNPTFKENDLDISKSEDVTEYVEIYNPTNADVSLADCVMRYAKGYTASESENPIVTVSDNPCVVKPGETAVLVCYQTTSAQLGYGYATDEEIKAYYDFFCELFGCADDLPLHSFYLFPRAESGTGTKISGRFNLANSHPDAVLRLAKGDEVLAECHYNAELWNKNNTGVNMMWHPGMDAEHPLTSKPLNTAGPNPGRLYANQVPNAALTAPADTLSIKAMEYNLQAEAKDQTAADGSTVTDAMRTQRIYEVISEHDPDVLALLEVNYRWLNQIDGALTGEDGKYTAYGRAAYGAYHDEEQKADTWDLTSLVLWKTEKFNLIDKGTFWCSKLPDRPASNGWGNGLICDLPRAVNWVILEDKETGAQFLFVAAHLDAKTAEIRALSADLIKTKTAELAEGLPIVILGDFNFADNSAAYKNIHGDTLYDARYLVPTYGNMTVLGTFNKFGANTDLQVRLPIDLCFVSPETVWVESASMDFGFADEGNSVYASDHNATVYELKLKQLHTVEPEPETETPTETPTEPVTDPVTDPVTEPDTPEATEPAETEEPTDPAATEAPTVKPEAPTEAPETEADKGGCGSVLSMAGVSVLLCAAAWIMADEGCESKKKAKRSRL